MGIMLYSLLWVVQDSYHQPYRSPLKGRSSIGTGSIRETLRSPNPLSYRTRVEPLQGLGFRV